MALNHYLYRIMSVFIPESRMYRLKAAWLSICGHQIHPSARISSSAKFIGPFSLAVGQDSFIGHQVLVAGGKCLISIGNHCDLGPRVNLIAGSHEIDMISAHSAGKGYSRDIHIENGVWLGANVTVLGGVRIGEKSIVGAGSIVTRDIPANVIAYGSPCKPRKKWNPEAQTWDHF